MSYKIQKNMIKRIGEKEMKEVEVDKLEFGTKYRIERCVRVKENLEVN